MNTNKATEKLITTLGVLPCVISDWGSCATPYEQKKHNLTKDIQMANDAVHEAATMLRILEGQLAFRIDAVTKYQAKVEEQQAEIEALKAQLQKEQE